MRQARLYLAASIAAAIFGSPPRAIADHIYVPAVREMTERRTMTSKTFLLADGTYRAEFHSAPINYKAADGSWQPIETTLTAASRPGFAVENETNAIRAYFPSDSTGWMRVESDSGAVSFRAIGGSPMRCSVEGNSLSFGTPWPQTTVRYQVQPGRLKETITLLGPGAPPVIEEALRLENLTAQTNSDGTVTLMDIAGRPSLTLERP